MDNEIKQENKIQTGCDQFTNPEEISVLSKYLKKNRQLLEDNTELGEDNLEVYGRRCGSLKNIGSLSNTVETIKDNYGISKLGDKVELVGENKMVEKLESSKETIQIGSNPTLENLIKTIENNTQLDNSLLEIPAEKVGNLGGSDIVLGGNTGKIIGNSDLIDNIAQESADKIVGKIEKNQLSKNLDKIDVSNEEKLEYNLDTLSITREEQLEKTKAQVVGDRKEKTTLEVDQSKIVGNTILTKDLESAESIILGDHGDKAVLGDSTEKIESTIQDSELTGVKERVTGNISEIELKGSGERLVGNIKDTGLDKTIEKVNIGSTIENLGGDRKNISGNIENTGLDETIEKINIENTIKNLGSDKKIISGNIKEPTGLGELKETISTNNIDELEISIKNIVGENKETKLNTGLSEIKKSGTSSNIKKLENSREQVEGKNKEQKKLEIGKEKVNGITPDIKKLEKDLDKLEHVSDIELDSKIESIDKYSEVDNTLRNSNDKISKEKSDISNLDRTTALTLEKPIEDTKKLSNELIKQESKPKSNNLEEHIVKLGIEDDKVELESAVVSKIKVTDEKKLSDNSEKIIEKNKDVENLEISKKRVRYNRLGKLEKNRDKIGDIKETSELSKTIGKVEGTQVDSDQTLSDVLIERLDNEGIGEVGELSKEIIDTEKDDTSKVSSEGKADHEQFENISDGGLYDTILGIIENDKFSFEPGDDPNKSDSLDTTIKNVLEAEHPSTDPDYIGSDYDPSSDKLGTGKDQYKKSYKRPGDDTSKINYGKNYKRDSEDDPGRDDYIHTGWEGKLSGSYDKVDSNDSLSDKTLSTDLIERLDNEGIGEVSELSSKKIDTKKDDTSKINYGKNYKRDSEDDPGRDDYIHTGWEGKLSGSYDKVDSNDSLSDKTLSTDLIERLDNEGIGEVSEEKRELEKWDSTKGNIKKSTNDEDNLTSSVTNKTNAKKLSKDGLGKDYVGELSKEDIELRDVLLSKQGGLNNYYENLLRYASSKNLSISEGWKEKVKSLVSSYLSNESINSTKAEEFEKQIFNTIIGDQGNVQLKRYQLSVSWSNAINSNKYIRWLAEKSVNWIPGKSNSWILGHKPSAGSIRESALDLVLMTLVSARRTTEVLTKSNRDRLPGNDTGLLQDIVQGQDTKTLAKKALSGLVTSIAKSGSSVANVDKEDPINRPYKYTETTGWQYGNNRLSPSINESKERSSAPNDVVGGNSKTNFLGGILKTLKAAAGEALLGNTSATPYSFNKNYLSSWGMTTTLQDLCGVVPANIDSVENLNIALKNSMYSTTVEKFSTARDNVSTGKTTTLDDNSFWEIVFDPFVGKDNGNYSYLPSIDEINVWNMLHFGVTTGYNRWIPFTSFDLSKNKVTTKSLSLFDGEINYPTSMEFTNELRLTIADDQYKSWRTYFERCSDASIYSSEPHKSSYYGYSEGYYTPTNVAGLTAIDKTFVCPALYKNITFRCIIFSLTPQLETISKYDLLVVLKDMAEERSGDIDPGGGDLTLTFSIVGENPNEFKYISNADVANAQYEASLKKAKAKETGKLLKSVAQSAGSQALSIIGI